MQVKEYLASNIIDIKELLSLALNKNTTWLYSYQEYELTQDENNAIQNLIQKRKQGYPFAYLSGVKGFYHLDFIVNEHTLIPRPETENIIDIVKKLDLQYAKVLDLGTGSGIIAITLKSLFPKFEITATDISPQTLAVAQKNAQRNNVNVDFVRSNWFENVKGGFDIIISNPPYIDKQSPYLQDLTFEPQGALVAADAGLADIKTIIKYTPDYLNDNGYLLLEHGFDQQQKITELLTKFSTITPFNDINGINRNILAQL